MGDDLIYYNGIPVGCWEEGHIVWLTTATQEAITALQNVDGKDSR